MIRLLTSVTVAATVMALPLIAPGTGEAASREEPLRFERLSIDSNERRDDGAAGPIRTERRLQRRARYLVTVQGTLSYYPQPMWLTPPAGQVVCGRPEPRPLYPSPGRPNGPVGLDAEMMFALPTRPAHCGRLDLPTPWKNFQVATGSRFTHPGTGRRTRPNRTHRYSYRVQGRGRPLRLRLLDSDATDNYGQLKVVVKRLRSAR